MIINSPLFSQHLLRNIVIFFLWPPPCHAFHRSLSIIFVTGHTHSVRDNRIFGAWKQLIKSTEEYLEVKYHWWEKEQTTGMCDKGKGELISQEWYAVGQSATIVRNGLWFVLWKKNQSHNFDEWKLKLKNLEVLVLLSRAGQISSQTLEDKLSERCDGLFQIRNKVFDWLNSNAHAY